MFNTTSERHNEFVGPIRIDPSPGEKTGEIIAGPAEPVAFKIGNQGNRKTSEGAVTEKMTDKESPLADIYTLLGVSQMSPMEGVRTRFYKLTRAIHRELLTTPDIDRRNKLLYDLKFICIAYDILSDPVTRTDYDLRTMGLRGVAMVQTPEEKKPGELGQRLHLKIGELLNVAGLLEASELEIACDMHKAMPEMQFGSFLVKQGFIEEYQLEAVLFAQKLLRKGLITVVQYQAAMEELESSGVAVAETVVERGYVTQSDLDHLEEVEAEAEAELNRPVEAPVYTQPSLKPRADDQVTSHSNLLAQMLPPGSPDVVSTRAGGNGEKSSGMLHKLLSGAQDGEITTPPSTMGGLLKGAAAPSAEPAAPAAAPVDGESTIAPGSGTPPPEHKEEKASRKKKNIELHEVAQAFDSNVSRGVNDIASDTYEGAAYKDDLLKPNDIKVTGELSADVQPPAAEPESFVVSGEGFLTADDAENSDNDIMSPAESDTASSDQLGFMDSASGVEFEGFVDSEVESDDEDEDEDDEEEDEGNITLIDSDGAQLVESAVQSQENDQDMPYSSVGRDKKTDSTHERIPAYAFSDRSLLDLDNSQGIQTGTAEIGQESGERIESIKSQSTTRDKVPVFRPPLHSTIHLDDASQQPGEPAGENPEDGGEGGDRQLVISNAVPSWKDNLEWSAPENQELQDQPSTTASQESEVVDISRHLDLEAIEPQGKEQGDDELKSFLGEEYKEDMGELSESGRPLWDVEDDEFIVPGGQKRQGLQQHGQAGQPGQPSEEDDRQAKRVSGGWQRLKNPFELQLDAQQATGRTEQATGEEAVVEVSNQEALEASRSETAEFVRPQLEPPHQHQNEHGDPATSSTDQANSFVEASDALSPEEEAYHVPLQGSSNPLIAIGLEDTENAEDAVAEVAEEGVPQGTSTTGEEPIVDEALSDQAPFEPPIFEATQDTAPVEDVPLADEPQSAEESQALPITPAPDDLQSVQEAATGDLVGEEEQQLTATLQDDTGSESDNGAAAQSGSDADTASDTKEAAAAGSDEESPLERRRRMLGRRHHKGKP